MYKCKINEQLISGNCITMHIIQQKYGMGNKFGVIKGCCMTTILSMRRNGGGTDNGSITRTSFAGTSLLDNQSIPSPFSYNAHVLDQNS